MACISLHYLYIRPATQTTRCLHIPVRFGSKQLENANFKSWKLCDTVGTQEQQMYALQEVNHNDMSESSTPFGSVYRIERNCTIIISITFIEYPTGEAWHWLLLRPSSQKTKVVHIIRFSSRGCKAPSTPLKSTDCKVQAEVIDVVLPFNCLVPPSLAPSPSQMTSKFQNRKNMSKPRRKQPVPQI